MQPGCLGVQNVRNKTLHKSVREAGAKSTRTVVRYLAEQGVGKKSGELPKETVRSADKLSLAAKGTKQGGRPSPVRGRFHRRRNGSMAAASPVITASLMQFDSVLGTEPASENRI